MSQDIMKIEPRELVFRDIRLNVASTTSFTIENPLSAAVEFTLRASAPARYDIKPSQIVLAPKQSIVVTVRLFLRTFSGTQQGGHSDSIHIKSHYFDQKIPVQFYMNSRATQSRSPSPRERTVSGLKSHSISNDLVNELNDQIKVKDHRIEELERIVGNLQSKYPDLERIINARLEDERSVFEEKSHKILKILRDKDDVVANLKAQLEESTRALQTRADVSQLEGDQHTLAEGKSRDYWTGRAVEPPVGLGMTHRELVNMLEKEKDAHRSCQQSLNEALSTMKDIQSSNNSSKQQLLGADSIGSGRLQLQDWQELRGLRAQTLDQADQIQTLLAENKRMQKKLQEQEVLGVQLEQAHKRVTRLNAELAEYQEQYAALKARHVAAEEAKGDLELTLREQRAECERLQQELEHSSTAQRSGRSNIGASVGADARVNTSRVSWQSDQCRGQITNARARQQETDRDRDRLASEDSHYVDDARFEESVGGGGLATSTPTQYSLHPPETTQQALHEKNALIHLLRDKLQDHEDEIERLNGVVASGASTEKELRERLQALETQLQGRSEEGQMLSARLERLRSEHDAVEHEAQAKDIALRSALERAAVKEVASEETSAHLWWAYLWHTMKQQQESAAAGDTPDGSAVTGQTTSIQPGNADFVPPHETAATVHTARMRDNLRMQAIEIAQLRQELIGKQLTTKLEMDKIKGHNEQLQHEVVNLRARSAIRSGDKDIKLAEKEKTIQTLSVRGDMYAQVAAARQEIEAEKLTSAHLRADVDQYRLMLEEEQRKVLLNRKEVANLQAQIDSSLVVQSVTNVPGVSPATLLSLMAGKITQLESEAHRSRQECEETTQQLRVLQKDMMKIQQQRRQSIASTPTQENKKIPSSAASSPGPRGRSLSPVPAGRRSSVSSGFHTSDPLRRSLSSSNLLASTGQSRAFAENLAADELNTSLGGDEDGMQSPTGSAGDWFSGAPGSIAIDGAATPVLVVQSLNRAVLAQRVASQEATIAELSQLVDELKVANLKVEREHLISASAADETDRIEWERSLRKVDLLQTLLDESRTEVKNLQRHNAELEKSLSAVHTSRMVEGTLPRANIHHQDSENTSVFYEDAPLLGNHTSDMGSYGAADVQYEETQRELQSTKIMLQERTTELKVLMATLESFEIAGVQSSSKFHSEDEYLFNRRPGDPSADEGVSVNTSAAPESFAYPSIGLGSRGGDGGLPSHQGSWGTQALIKRVVELTTELTSQCAEASLEKRRAEDLELRNRSQAKEVNYLKKKLQNSEETTSRASLQLTSVCNQLQEGDRTHIEAISSLRAENDALTTALRESEAALEASEIKVSALRQQAEVADQADFMSWLEFVTLDNQKVITERSSQSRTAGLHDEEDLPPAHTSANDSTREHVVFGSKKLGESTVRELVESLVLQWKQFVGTVPQLKPLTTPAGGMPKISPTEQRFLKRVTELVLEAHDRANKAETNTYTAAARVQQVENANQIAIERLKICASHLNRYRKRCHAFEKVLSVDRKHTGLKQGKLEAMLKKNLNVLRGKYNKTVDVLREERRERMINDVKRAMDTQELRKLQAQIAEFEARGTTTLRAREDAITSVEGKLKFSEDSLQKWFKVELPRLVSGLPATEDTLSSYYYKENVNPHTNYDASAPYALSGSSESASTAPISTHLMSALGMDRTYALSQALCSTQAARTAQDQRIALLTEKISILKERNLALEGVLVRWKDEIQQSAIANTTPTVGNNAAHMMQAVVQNEGDQEEDGLDQYLSRIPSIPAAGTVQGSVATMANANRVDAAIHQIHTLTHNEALLTNQVRDLTKQLLEVEEQNIELKGKCEQASARADEMKGLVDVVMGDEQQLKTKATQQLTRIRLNLEKEHAEELRRIRQSYETEKNNLVGELEAVAKAVEEAKLTSVDTTAWQRMVASAEAGEKSEGFDPHYGTQPQPTPVRTYVRTPPYVDHDEQDETKEMRRKETRKRGKGKASRKHAKRHSRKKRESSTERSSTTVSTSSTESSEETSSSSSSSEDDPAAPQNKTSRRRAYRSTSRERTRKRDRSAGQRTDRAGVDDTDPVGAAAREYAQTLRASAEGLSGREQPAPRTATRHTSSRDPMDVRFTPSTNADTSTPSLSLSYINQQQDLVEVQVENLQRQLDMERRMHEETKAELAELASMHQIQKSVFQEHLNRSSSAGGGGGHEATLTHPTAAGTTTTGGAGKTAQQSRKERESRQSQSLKEAPKKTADTDFVSLSSFDESVSVPSLSPPVPEHSAKASAQPLSQHRAPHETVVPAQQSSFPMFPQPSQHRDESYLDISGMGGEGPAPSLSLDPVSVMINEIQREDPGLWPSLSTLLDELLCVLQGLSERAVSLDTRMEARTALAMAARVRVVCTSSSTARNLSSSIAAATSKADFPADKLLRELNKYTANPAAQADSVDEKSVGRTRATLDISSVEEGADKDLGSRLQSLANRVRMIETDFADDNIPERHLYLMRDLRMRIQEVEKALRDETVTQQSKWTREREELLRKVSENAELAEQQRRGQSDTMSTIRQRYEETLKSTQETMEQNNQASNQELERLRTVLAKKEQQIQLQQQLLQQNAAQMVPPQVPPAEHRTSVSQNLTVTEPYLPVPVAPVTTTAASIVPTATVPATTTADTLNEFLRMQRLVNQSGDQIDLFRQQRRQLEAHHTREVAELKAHFSRYQRAQAEVVRSLEDQLEELHDENAALQASTEENQRGVAESSAGGLGGRLNVNDSLAGGHSLASQVSSLPEAEDVIRKMEFRFRMKSAELDAVLRTMSRMGDSGAGENQEQFSLLDNTLHTVEEADLPPRPRPPTNAGPSTGYRYGNINSAMQQHTSTRSSRDIGIGASDMGEGSENLPRDMQLELYEARMAAADKEVEALHRNLQKERTINANLKAQLQTMQEQTQKPLARGRTTAETKTTGLRPARAAEEPVEPSLATAPISVPFVPAGLAGSTMNRERTAARPVSRRGSTGSLLRPRGGGDASIPTFSAAPAPSTAPPEPTAASLAGDPLLDFTQEYAVPEIPSDSEKMRLLVRRLNELRRSARVEISRLKGQLSTAAVPTKLDEGSTIADLRLQIVSLKDDNSRKAKLVADLKSAKAAGGTTLEQWKTEAAHLEENAKRLQRAVNSKDAVIKDLKARLEAVEGAVKAAHHEGIAPTTAVLAGLGLDEHSTSSKAPGIGSPAPVDVSSLSAAELRARLRSSELERARNRTRLQSLKEKVTELETEKRHLEEENAKLRAQGERSESMRSALVRKDTVLQSLRTEVDKLKSQVEELRTREQVLHLEFEKKEKQLHRQLETERRSRTDLEQESQLMRQRMVDSGGVTTSAELRGPTRSVGDYLSNSSATSGSNAATGDLFRSSTARTQTSTTTAASNESRKSPVPVQRRSSIGMSASTPRSTTELGDLPAPLDSTQDDLRDVMDALGVTPLHLGLGLNPRSSTISSAYTRNTSGRGSTLDRENLASPGEESAVSAGTPRGSTAAELSSVERRFKTLVKSSLQSPVRQRRL